MARSTIDLTGDEKLLQKMESLEKKDAMKAVRKAVRAGFKLVLQSVKSRIPVDTGAMKKHTKLRAGKRSRFKYTMTIDYPKRSQLGIDEGDKHYYPAVIEYGDGKRKAYKPMRKGFDSRASAAQSRFRRVLWAEILKAIK